MPHIQQLSSHVADLIAAGEVVERPASVAKELLENAIDAGSSAIVVEIQHGGLTYLRIADNGCGIDAEQLPTAFLRHATSKLRTAADLTAIGTLGFRGEALAAISAVSRVDNPAVQRLVKEVLQQAKAHGVEVYLCGITIESISRIPVYLHLGVRTFSVEPAALLPLKKLLMEETLEPSETDSGSET